MSIKSRSGREQLTMQHPKEVMHYLHTQNGERLVINFTLGQNIHLSFLAVPTLVEIRLQLTELSLSPQGMDGSVAWLVEGINIEEVQ